MHPFITHLSGEEPSKFTYWLVFISIAAVISLFFIEPIAQDLNYHNFADKKMIYGVPNFWNVVSNIPFLIVGIIGLSQLKRLTIIAEMELAYWIIFSALILVAFGSSYYHLNPTNKTLVWDRLPMTLAFMSLFSVIIAEFINEQKGSIMLFPLLIIGLLSVLYWNWTESKGVGDLRFYALVQFLPIIIIPLLLLFSESKFSKKSGYWWLLLAYILAKILEYYDNQIFQNFGQLMSGHAIKHVAAALGMYVLLSSYRTRGSLIP